MSGPLELLARLGAAVRGSLADIGDAARLLLRLLALVPAALARAGLQGVRFVPIAGLRHLAVGALVWHEEADSPALRALIDCARGCLQEPFLQSPPP